MCNSEQDERDRLNGKIARLADDLGITESIRDRMSGVMSNLELAKMADELENRVDHRKGYQELIGEWFTRMDRVGRNTGD